MAGYIYFKFGKCLSRKSNSSNSCFPYLPFHPLCGFMHLCVHPETRGGGLESFSISLHRILETALSLNPKLVSVRLTGQWVPGSSCPYLPALGLEVGEACPWLSFFSFKLVKNGFYWGRGNTHIKQAHRVEDLSQGRGGLRKLKPLCLVFTWMLGVWTQVLLLYQHILTEPPL